MPPIDVNQFRASFTGDGARPNLFQVTLQFPAVIIAGAAQAASRQLSFMCRTAQLPGSTIGQIPLQYMGRETKLAGNRSFQDLSLTIFNDEDFLTRNAFEQWMASINTHTTNLRVASAKNSLSYGVDMKVEQLGKGAGEIIKSYKFIGAWPTDLSQIDVDWATNDTIEEYTVTMAYQYWVSEADGIK